MNHPFVVQQAKALLGRADIKGADAAGRIRRIYEHLFQRMPRADEMEQALRFVQVDEPRVIAQVDHSKSWQYGVGEWDESTGRVKDFKPLPHFTGSAWQGDEAWPNEKLGWAQLTATGGHPGNDRKHAVVRRWIASSDGTYAVKSTLLHEAAPGDGIRSFISHSQQGRLHAGRLHQGCADLNFNTLAFKEGETLDFVVDIGEALNSDQFLWSMRIHQTGSVGAGGDDVPAQTWDAEKDFAAQPRSQLNGWEQFVQVLMLANEFMFVD
ncbi:MAG: Planctomycete cytochrome [Prosthecobacter sp.]|nr:Planctomycete cytochrome [Prosthecobacter sp.]